YTDEQAWRYSMVIPGLALLALGIIYFFFTKDTPDGNLSEIKREAARDANGAPEKKTSFFSACKDYRVWILFLAYGAWFGIEITIDNIATLYFVDHFQLGLKEAGIIAGLFGMMNIFARALGGIFGDRAGNRYGLRGRVFILGAFL